MCNAAFHLLAYQLRMQDICGLHFHTRIQEFPCVSWQATFFDPTVGTLRRETEKGPISRQEQQCPAASISVNVSPRVVLLLPFQIVHTVRRNIESVFISGAASQTHQYMKKIYQPISFQTKGNMSDPPQQKMSLFL